MRGAWCVCGVWHIQMSKSRETTRVRGGRVFCAIVLQLYCCCNRVGMWAVQGWEGNNNNYRIRMIDSMPMQNNSLDFGVGGSENEYQYLVRAKLL